MGKQTEHYKTVQGDTWDLISKKIWGDSKYKKYFDLLIIANREYTDTLMSRIDDEAKNQSEDETSLITGKSKEELRQLRDQVKQAINYPEDYLTKDDILTM